MKLDAQGIHYRELNEQIHQAIGAGAKEIDIENVCGHRYIGAALDAGVRIDIHGVPGNDLGAFMNGAEIVVHANAQDGVGNTMSAGKIVVHGDAGEVLAHSMRGGRIYVRGGAGYRVGIHMKSYQDNYPVVIIGGHVGDYAGEYMAGGLLIVLGMDTFDQGAPPAGRYVATGMHGGKMYLRGQLEEWQLGREVGGVQDLTDEDKAELQTYLEEFCADQSLDCGKIDLAEFIKLSPLTHRPYGKIYVY